MNWLKQNWIKVMVGLFAVTFLFFLKTEKDNSQSVATLTTSSPTPSEKPNLPAYDLVYPDLVSDVKSVYGKSELKTTIQNLNDLFGENKTPNPFIIKAGSYEISFGRALTHSLYNDGSTSNSFEDLKILKNNKVVFGDTTESPERKVQRFVTVTNTDYGGKSYYLIEGWGGGAHCCEYFYPVVISGNNIKVGEQFDNGDDGNYGFFVKNGSVYIWMQNSNFSYFISSYAVSNVAFFPSFYRIDTATGNLIPSDSEFKTFYAQFVNQRENEVEKLKKGNFDEGTRYRWQPVLAARTIYQLKSGQNKDEVMKQFDTDFRILKEKYQISEFISSYATGWDFKSIEENGLPDEWYSSGGLEKIKYDILKGALGEKYSGKI